MTVKRRADILSLGRIKKTATEVRKGLRKAAITKRKQSIKMRAKRTRQRIGALNPHNKFAQITAYRRAKMLYDNRWGGVPNAKLSPSQRAQKRKAMDKLNTLQKGIKRYLKTTVAPRFKLYGDKASKYARNWLMGQWRGWYVNGDRPPMRQRQERTSEPEDQKNPAQHRPGFPSARTIAPGLKVAPSVRIRSPAIRVPTVQGSSDQ